MDSDNPYRPPQTPALEDNRAADFRDLVVGWESLRIRYNLILLPLGLLAFGLWASVEPDVDLDLIVGLIVLAVAFGIAANLCYFLGPLAELYARGIFAKSGTSPRLRKVLYWTGTGLSAALILGFAILGVCVHLFADIE